MYELIRDRTGQVGRNTWMIRAKRDSLVYIENRQEVCVALWMHFMGLLDLTTVRQEKKDGGREKRE